jgi:CHASE3 domain sensor protein
MVVGRIELGHREPGFSVDQPMNDRTLSDCVFLITQKARQLDELLRDNRLIELRDALQAIQDVAKQGGYRCNDLRYGKKNEA